MADYKAPLDDMNFLLYDVFNAEQLWAESEALSEYLDRDTSDAILQECAKIAEQEIAPISRQGDEIGIQFDHGKVTTPPGFKQAFTTYSEGGWIGLGGEVEHGGMGMPKMLTALQEEIVCSADMAFSLYPGLTSGACLLLAKHGSDELKQRFLPNMYSGQWAGTMCLTEAHAGTDLGMMRTKAEPCADGSYQLTGSKIFITGGEQDLTENIIHLVLAKLPDAPAGSKGISLFLVPKLKVNDDGSLGEHNGVVCGSTEHKMGIHASATCVLNFDQAQGYLVGEVNQGLACMFTMMNYERIGVGIQGLGAGVRSYQNALEYAKERIQGRSLSGAKSPEQAADSIMVHGDVRRMLLSMKALNEGNRALAMYVSKQLDLSQYGSGVEQQKGGALTALMTPLAKAFFTDVGLENTIAGQQVLGGHGYIREWGQEQLVRDARIAQIYEGTNGVQAMDLIGRKLAANKGQYIGLFVDEVRQFIESHHSDRQLAEFIEPLAAAIDDLVNLTQSILTSAADNPEQLGSAANDYLHVFGYTALAYMWALMAKAAQGKQGDFYRAKLITARYFFARILPRRQSLAQSAASSASLLFELEDDLF
ncbi:acyl-CoA dehydrogenase C-terminal domain-containing protein [Thalassotalea ponticola]|uniref:acyl-CoA dehydrogenase C-terminal domain-containing protein n=1 Tax=Thalassotalea ponticola TaxID=1523392 RepID=UPI0025B5F17D|nr:acyl-CoA dehydrogenase C-terminal domain-containing protein [Thalassotalea ponticola]MDN3653626.1 acyl-CoA dehydrogenase C-terminal domain-containing protein [Thalassotalea ponticola]